MSVEDKIINNSDDPIKGLANRAKKAQATPDNGVKIITKGAYFVIRDCAMITNKFLPNYLYGKYENPIKSLKGKFTTKEIILFCAKNDIESKQLRQAMVLDALEVIEPTPVEDTIVTTGDDIYGDYGSDTELVEEEQEFNWEDGTNIVDVLTKAFNAK